jgi:hypothetical protein
MNVSAARTGLDDYMAARRHLIDAIEQTTEVRGDPAAVEADRLIDAIFADYHPGLRLPMTESSACAIAALIGASPDQIPRRLRALGAVNHLNRLCALRAATRQSL